MKMCALRVVSVTYMYLFVADNRHAGNDDRFFVLMISLNRRGYKQYRIQGDRGV